MYQFVMLVKKYWLALSCLILASITLLSLTPLPHLPAVPGSDKTHHFIAYGLLIFPLALKKPKYWLVMLLFCIIWSGLIELIQPYTNRYGEWLDLFANIGGLSCGVVIAQLINKLYPSPQETS